MFPGCHRPQRLDAWKSALFLVFPGLGPLGRLQDGEDWPEKIPGVELEESPSQGSVWNPDVIVTLHQELGRIAGNVPVS